tara:strand:- start:836 stop:991 length:156 start_codon:yes stop_codon:yes gene_type:complete
MTKRNEKEILAAFTHMAINELGGTMDQCVTSNSMGRTSKKIIIEYDIKDNK